jgi:hypothetical protein
VLYEDPSYLALLLLFRGELRPFEVLDAVEPGSVAFCTRANGVACWHLLHGERDAAEELWQKVLESPQWAAFGCLAAEAELAGLGARRAAP